MKELSANNEAGRQSVVAIVQQGREFKAVGLHRVGDKFDILWTQSGRGRQFIENIIQSKQDAEAEIVIGFDSSQAVFYRITAPAVKADELEAIVALQAEALLPLPVEQMELAWRAGNVHNDKQAVTIVAARTDKLLKFVETVRICEPWLILLDGEGIVKAWKVFFGDDKRQCAIINIRDSNTQVCFAEDGQLALAVTLDLGSDDFSATGKPESRTLERFAQDMRSAFEHFGFADTRQLPAFIVCQNRNTAGDIIGYLATAGFDMPMAEEALEKPASKTELSVEQFYEYFVPIGLAMTALEPEGDQLNIFRRLYRPARQEKKSSPLPSLKSAVVIVVIMLAAFLFFSYKIDSARLNRINHCFAGAEPNTSANLFFQRQKISSAIAGQRPDVLDLLINISKDAPDDMMLDSLAFKKGQLVSIAGHINDRQKLNKFAESLQDRGGIKAVKIQKCSLDEKEKQHQFVITFDYKNFTQKKRPL